MLITNDVLNGDVVSQLRNGGIGIIPTDTVYGIVCRAADKEAVGRLYAAKHRESKPGTVIAAHTQQLIDLGIKARYVKPVEAYWPNPISVVIPNFELGYIHLGRGGIAVRIPKDDKLHEMLLKTGPLLTSSANQPGEPEATNIEEAKGYFNADVDFYVNGGDLSGREASTVIRIVDDAVEVLRQGSIKINEDGTIA